MNVGIYWQTLVLNIANGWVGWAGSSCFWYLNYGATGMKFGMFEVKYVIQLLQWNVYGI